MKKMHQNPNFIKQKFISLNALLICIFTLLTQQIANAQQDEAKQKATKNVLKIGILPDLYQPAIPVFYEHYFNPGLSLQTGFGYLLQLDNDDWRMEGFNFRCSEEIRRYIKEGRFYNSFEVRYMQAKYSTRGSYSTYDQGMKTIFREDLLIRKQTLSFIPKMGYHSVRKHLSFDIWMGVGAKFKSVGYLNADPRSAIDIRTDVAGFELMRRDGNKDGDYWKGTFVFNITFGYAF